MGEMSWEMEVKRTIRKPVVKPERGGAAISYKNASKCTVSLEFGNHKMSEEGIIWETISKITVKVVENPIAPRKGVREVEACE